VIFLWGPSRRLLNLSFAMRNFLNLKRLATILQTPRGRFGSVAASFIIFFAAFVLLYPRFGWPITVLGFIPILIGAWFYGIWAGLLFTFALYAIDVLIIVFLNAGNIPIAMLPGELLGLATGMALSLIMGRQGELSRRNQEKFRQSTTLLEEAQQRVNELAGLQTISRAFTLHGDARLTFGLLTETLAGLMGVKMCSISLYNAATHELLPQPSAYGLDDKQMVVLHYSPETGKADWDFLKSGIFRANFEAEILPEFIPFAQSLIVDCMLVAPLWDIEERLLGVILVANKPGGFADKDIHQLKILGRQVAAVIQNAGLLNAERTRAEQLAVLHAVATAATESTNEDQLIEHVTLIIGQRLYSDRFGILLLDESTHELYLHCSYRIGSHEDLAGVPMGVGVMGTVAKSGKPMRVNDVSASPDYLSLYPLTRSELCVPLMVESKIVGVVNAESTQTNAFTGEDEELLTIIAGQLATTIQRLRTVQAERYQTQKLERSNSLIRALGQVNARAAVASDPDSVLQTLGNELAKLGLRCAIALSDTSNQHIILRYISLSARLMRALERITAIRLQNYAIPISKLTPISDRPQNAFLVQDALATLISWAPDLPKHNATKILKMIGVTRTTSVCYLPLIIDGKPMGVLWMWGEGLHESDMPTMSLFASQLAAALQNANLLTEVGRLAITDELTGIYNRRYFFEMAEKKFARALKNKNPLSVLLVDIDHFKKFNDSYGHVVGDQVLRASAQMMVSALRESDILRRYGGEEFSIILPDTNNSAAIYAAERLLAKVSDIPIDTEAGKLSIQISIGIAGMSKETPTLHSLIVRADQAMYIAKSAGRNRLAVK